MPTETLFLDTSYILGLLDSKDNLHERAKSLIPRFKKAKIWVTEAILTEVGNAFGNGGKSARERAVKFIEGCYDNKNFEVVSIDSFLFRRAVELYKRRSDKTYGLVDCISFIVMRENNIINALTYDLDFVQEGFVALMRD